MKKGFSLVELIVVVAIIGVLATVLLSTFGRSSESARAAVCLNNMKVLAQAANAYAMESGWYPVAGSCEGWSHTMKGMRYHENHGWVSWLSNHDEYGESGCANAHQSIATCPFYGTENEIDALHALTNGAIWKSCGRNRTAYTCPTHVKKRSQKKLKAPIWSYVMNGYFGYDHSQGSSAVYRWEDGYRRRYNALARKDRHDPKHETHRLGADKVLMFAELDVDPPDGDGSDCTLQSRGSINGIEYGTEWKGTPEKIGFPHSDGRKRQFGHVVFADCHTEKIYYAEGGMSMEDLTVHLCYGFDVSYDGKSYQDLPDQD